MKRMKYCILIILKSIKFKNKILIFPLTIRWQLTIFHCNQNCKCPIYAFLPQQFLYFLPEPHVVETPIFIILIIFIILLIFQGFSVLVIYYIYNIYSIFVIINISLLQTNRKQCLHSFTTVIILSISYIYQCAFCIFAHLLYYKYLFLSMDLSNYLYLII